MVGGDEDAGMIERIIESSGCRCDGSGQGAGKKVVGEMRKCKEQKTEAGCWGMLDCVGTVLRGWVGILPVTVSGRVQAEWSGVFAPLL